MRIHHHPVAVDVSVIIPTLNEELYIGRTLESLHGDQDFRFEVIVVDSSVNVYTKEVVLRHAETLDVKYTHTSRQDIGHQRNLGAQLATYHRLLFLDADTVLGEGTLIASARLDAGNVFVAAIKHLADRDSVSIRIGMKVIYALIFLSRAVGLPVTNGDFILTNKRTYESVGGFKEGYLLGEDTDFGLRARRAGAKAPIMWTHHVIACSRRLTRTSVTDLIWIWARAYVRAILVGPTPKKEALNYRFGDWGRQETVDQT